MRTLMVEPNMWFWILICLFIQVSDTQMYYSTGNTRYCYVDPDFCVECGCFETGLTEHTLRCRENEVIRMEFYNNQIKSRPFNHDTSRSCILIRDGQDYCYMGFGDNNLTTTYTDRIDVYRNCTLQNNCTITVKPVKEGNVKLVRYPYVCESNIQNISKPFTGELSNPVFYFKGIDYINKTIDCDCSVYNRSGNIEVEIFYIHGDNVCNKLDILPNTQLIKCKVDDIQLYTTLENITSNFLKIKIRNMTVTGDEVVFFKLHGRDLDVTCTGCTTKPESESSTSQETTSTILNNVYTSSSGQSCDPNLNNADFISRTEYEEKLNQNNAMFGGIIAAIIIINIVTIGIYCFISKRNKAETSSESEYANTEFRLPDETESPQYQGLNL